MAFVVGIASMKRTHAPHEMQKVYPKPMRLAIRVLIVLAVFVGVGVLTAHLVLTHHANAGAYEPQVKLGADTAGLFAGGLAALVALIVVVRTSSRSD